MKFNNKTLLIKLGLTIAYYRKFNDITQEDLAKMCNLSLNHIARIETARVSPSLNVIFLIAKTLKIPTYKLFEFRE